MVIGEKKFFCRELANTRPTKELKAFFAFAESLPTSATLLWPFKKILLPSIFFFGFSKRYCSQVSRETNPNECQLFQVSPVRKKLRDVLRSRKCSQEWQLARLGVGVNCSFSTTRPTSNSLLVNASNQPSLDQGHSHPNPLDRRIKLSALAT